MESHTIRHPFAFLMVALSSMALTGCPVLPDEAYVVDPGVPAFTTLRLDANPQKTAVTIYDEQGRVLDAAALLSKRIVGNDHGGERAIPRSIRATWRTGAYVLTRNGEWTGGTLMGDYTTTVAERIPPEVFAHMRQHGGGLRLKIRVIDGAVLVGWDIERYVPVEGWKPGDGDSGFHYTMVGGDFREDQIVDGKVVKPGWEHAPPAPPSTQ